MFIFRVFICFAAEKSARGALEFEDATSATEAIVAANNCKIKNPGKFLC